MTFAHAREASGQDEVVAQVDGSLWLGPIVTIALLQTRTRLRHLKAKQTQATYRFLFSSLGIENANLLVLARCHDTTAIPAPGHVEDNVGQRHSGQHFARAHIPNDYLAIGASTEQHIVGRRMPGDEADTTLMANQLDHWLIDGPNETVLGYLPHLHRGVLGRAGNHLIVERTPGNVEHGPFVASHQGMVHIDATSLKC